MLNSLPCTVVEQLLVQDEKKKVRRHSSLPYARPLSSAMRPKDKKKKKKARRVSFQLELEAIDEENEAPAPPAFAPVKRGGSFTEMFKKMNLG